MAKLFSFRPLTTLALAATASACSATDPAGLVAASRLDPLNTPPSEIAVAVGVPRTLQLADGDAEFRLSFSGGSAASTILVEEVVPLRIAPPTDTGPRQSAPDETVYIARIAPEDGPKIAAAQQEIRDLRAAGIDGGGSLTVRVVGGCFIGDAPGSIAVSTWLQTDATDGFVPLTRRQDVTRAFGARGAAMLRSKLRPCAEAETAQ